MWRGLIVDAHRMSRILNGLCFCWKGECIMIVVCNRVACRAPLIGMSREN